MTGCWSMCTYTLHVGKMGEAVKLYTELGYPALQKGGQDKKLVGYFQADTGTINQLVHLEVRRRCRPSRALGVGLRQQALALSGLRRGGDPFAVCRVSGGELAYGGAVGTTSLSEVTS